MKIINVDHVNIPTIHDEVCAAIGNFDGIHLAHQKLIEECKSHRYKSAVLTFEPHPMVSINKDNNFNLITPFESKCEVFEQLDIDYLIVIKFTNEIKDMLKEDFIKLMKSLNIKACVCGYDFHFGKNREGNVNDLKQEFEVFEISKYQLNDIRISSSHIKTLINEGNVNKVKEFLGRYYKIKGKVISGSKKGRTIGFPTANIDYGLYILPKNGVYCVKVKLNEQYFMGMCNIGNNPTFNYSTEKRVEVNIFDLNETIYNTELEIIFIERLRDEIEFKNVDELINQLKEDKINCINILNKI